MQRHWLAVLWRERTLLRAADVAAAVEPQIATASIKSKSFCTVVQGEENSTAIMMTSPDVLTPANDVHFGKMKLELKPNLSAKSNPDEIDLEEHE